VYVFDATIYSKTHFYFLLAAAHVFDIMGRYKSYYRPKQVKKQKTADDLRAEMTVTHKRRNKDKYAATIRRLLFQTKSKSSGRGGGGGDSKKEEAKDEMATLRCQAVVEQSVQKFTVKKEKIPTCIFCFEHGVSEKKVVVPCGHYYCCEFCPLKEKNCAICRSEIQKLGSKEDVEKVFAAGACDSDAKLLTIKYNVASVSAGQSFECDDQCLLIDDVEKLCYLLAELAKENGYSEYTKMPMLLLAEKSPSLFWSVYKMVFLNQNDWTTAFKLRAAIRKELYY